MGKGEPRKPDSERARVTEILATRKEREFYSEILLSEMVNLKYLQCYTQVCIVGLVVWRDWSWERSTGPIITLSVLDNVPNQHRCWENFLVFTMFQIKLIHSIFFEKISNSSQVLQRGRSRFETMIPSSQCSQPTQGAGRGQVNRNWENLTMFECRLDP